jgi:hypothetical protein
MAGRGEKLKMIYSFLSDLSSYGRCTGPGFFVSNTARQIMPPRLQIPFYKRAGFLGIYAHVCGSLVKPR